MLCCSFCFVCMLTQSPRPVVTLHRYSKDASQKFQRVCAVSIHAQRAFCLHTQRHTCVHMYIYTHPYTYILCFPLQQVHLKTQWFFGPSKKIVNTAQYKVGALQYVEGNTPAMYVVFDNENTVFEINMNDGILTKKFNMPSHECKSSSCMSL